MPLSVRRYEGGESRIWGIFCFMRAPCIGETITLASDHTGWTIKLRITAVNHEPLRDGETPEPPPGEFSSERFAIWLEADYVSGPPKFDTEGDRYGPAHPYHPPETLVAADKLASYAQPQGRSLSEPNSSREAIPQRLG